MKRTGFKSRGKPMARHPKKKRAASLVPKADTRSKVDKGPARDKAHLAKVRNQPCLVALRSKLPYYGANRCSCWGRVEAHHTHIFPNSAYGKKPSDYLTVPICTGHHTRWPHDSVHGQLGESGFWRKHGIDPARWIAEFSAEGRAALELIERRSQETA